jgi:hypothetical protein
MLQRLILLQLVLDTVVPFIFLSQSPVISINFSFHRGLVSRIKVLRLEKICEFLEQFSDFMEH